jgi:hypothetical protein
MAQIGDYVIVFNPTVISGDDPSPGNYKSGAVVTKIVGNQIEAAVDNGVVYRASEFGVIADRDVSNLDFVRRMRKKLGVRRPI